MADHETNTLALEGRPPSLFKPTNTARRNTRLITLEEHAVSPFPTPSTSVTFETFDATFVAGLKARLADIKLRVQVMDTNNIGAQIISLNQPTAQAFVELAPAVEFCRKANQFIYEHYVQAYPNRFFAFATLPTQSGQAAADELERCVKEYGFVGAMINGFTNTADPTKGLYLDDPQFDALWEVSERLGKPIFIHPRVPLPSNLKVLEGFTAFHGAPYGFARETVEHVLRIMYSGVFDRFPKLKICLGHCGEGLSWILPRTDTTFRMYSKGKSPSFPMADNRNGIAEWKLTQTRCSRPQKTLLHVLLPTQYPSQHIRDASNLGPSQPHLRDKAEQHHVQRGLPI